MIEMASSSQTIGMADASSHDPFQFSNCGTAHHFISAEEIYTKFGQVAQQINTLRANYITELADYSSEDLLTIILPSFIQKSQSHAKECLHHLRSTYSYTNETNDYASQLTQSLSALIKSNTRRLHRRILAYLAVLLTPSTLLHSDTFDTESSTSLQDLNQNSLFALPIVPEVCSSLADKFSLLLPEDGSSLISEECSSLLPEECSSLFLEECSSLFLEECSSLLLEECSSLVYEECSSILYHHVASLLFASTFLCSMTLLHLSVSCLSACFAITFTIALRNLSFAVPYLSEYACPSRFRPPLTTTAPRFVMQSICVAANIVVLSFGHDSRLL
jgi:hypothetical protein